MSKKVFALDMDGTLLNSHDAIPEFTLEALKQAKAAGHVNAICTGRSYFDIVEKRDISDVFDFLVCNNGTYLYDMKLGEVIMNKTVPAEVALAAIDFAIENKTILILQTHKGSYHARTWTDEPEWLAKLEHKDWHLGQSTNQIHGIDFLRAAAQNEKVTQIAVAASDEIINKLINIASSFEGKASLASNKVRGALYLDFNPTGINKLVGLEALGKQVGVEIANFVAFGDSNNDLEMLAGAGLGIAMGNGTPEAKAAAKEIIGHHDTDAIAKKVLELI